MRAHGVLRAEVNGVKVEMDPTLLSSARVVEEKIEQPEPERVVAGGGPKTRAANVNPLLKHKSLGLGMEFSVPIAP